MTVVDWVIVGFTLLLAIYGYSQGFVVGALSLVGFVAGALIGTRIGPALLPDGSASPYAPAFGLAGALVAGAILAAGLEAFGFAIRRRLKLPGLGAVDGIAGALLTAFVALGITWIAGAVLLQTPEAREIRRDIQRSAILGALNELLPPSGPILNALARYDPFPEVSGPSADVAPPQRGILRDPEVRAAERSVVRVLGSACGLGIQGSGWVAARGVVVTNAHVVAGEQDTEVQLGIDGPELDATVVAFDVRNDVAVLLVDGLDRPPLPLAPTVPSGRAGAILGFPENGPYAPRPGRVGATEIVRTQDAYGQGPVERAVVTLRGRVRSGNSGGPMVDARGQVLTTIFATAVDAERPGGFGVPNDIVRSAVEGARGPVSTGSCAG